MKKKNKINSNLFKIDDSKLKSYPSDEIKPSDFSSETSDYKIVDIIYSKPLGDNTKTEITLILEDKKEKLHNCKKEVHFAFSENDRIAASVSPTSFALKKKIQNAAPPNKILPGDFVAKHKGVMIMSVEYTQPEVTQNETIVNLVVRINSLNSVVNLDFPIKFAKTKEQEVLEEINKDDFVLKTKEDEKYNLSIQHVKYIGAHNIEIIQSKITTKDEEENSALVEIEIKFGNKTKWVKFTIIHKIPKRIVKMNHYLSMVKIKPGFLDGCSPINPKPDFVVFPKELKLVSMRFNPPKTKEETLGSVDLLFSYSSELGKLKLDLEFSYSIKAMANKIMQHVSGEQIVYLQEDIVAPPDKFSIDDFKMPDEDIKIDFIKYDLKSIKPTDHEVRLKLICNFRTIEIKFNKIITFKMSRIEYITSSKLAEDVKEDMIHVPNIVKNPDFLFKWSKNSSAITKKILDEFYIAPPYSFNFSQVKLKSFSVNDRKVVIDIYLKEKINGKIIEKDLEKTIQLKETYAESIINDWTEKDIKFNNDLMNPYPPDKLVENLFADHELFNIISTQYIRPNNKSKLARVNIQIGAGIKTANIIKEIKYEYSKFEYTNLLWEEEDRKSLADFDVSKVNIHVNILGEPVEDINSSQITGVPLGIEIETKYSQAKWGESVSELFVLLKKNLARRTFKQKIIFSKPRTKQGDIFQKTHVMPIAKISRNKN